MTNVGDAPSRDSILRLFRKAHREWPTFLSDSGPAAERAFFALSDEERHGAVEHMAAYIAAVRRDKGKICSFQVYLREKRWEKLPADHDKLNAAKPSADVLNKPFGPVWAGLRMLRLLKGPMNVDVPDDFRQAARSTFEGLCKVSDVRAQAYLARKGIFLDGDELVFPIDFDGAEYRKRALDTGFAEVNRMDEQRTIIRAEAWCSVFLDLCEFVPIGTEMFERWRGQYAAMNWPFVPVVGAMQGAWFPRGGPEGLDEFETAARAAKVAEERNNDHAA